MFTKPLEIEALANMPPEMARLYDDMHTILTELGFTLYYASMTSYYAEYKLSGDLEGSYRLDIYVDRRSLQISGMWKIGGKSINFPNRIEYSNPDMITLLKILRDKGAYATVP